ncbi:hypothetical protein MEQU1_000219 [Malassezia equina]|uniref:Uncharacterized protein n=1 Tax=Malassezia equina TaxID=1381935 RepID=A0AAF0EBF8_9BASI|nr:hypothetical protein MEQU1_000219 [Malassezia equina]
MAEAASTSHTALLAQTETEVLWSEDSGESSGSQSEAGDEDAPFSWQDSLASQVIPPSPRLTTRTQDAFWSQEADNAQSYGMQWGQDPYLEFQEEGNVFWGFRRTNVQQSLAPQEHTRLIPSSYRRFLWFMGSLGLSLVSLLAGQSYAIVYMKTLPHTGIDGTLYVAFWMLTVHLFSAIVQWIMSEKLNMEMRLYPELVPTLVWTSLHVLMNMLFFLIQKLNFS